MDVQTRRDIYKKWLKIEVKLLLSAIGSHICRVNWHNNG